MSSDKEQRVRESLGHIIGNIDRITKIGTVPNFRGEGAAAQNRDCPYFPV